MKRIKLISLLLIHSIFLFSLGCDSNQKQRSKLSGTEGSLLSENESPSDIISSIPSAIIVDQTGQAATGFPIVTLAPGNGLAPKLSLSYSSGQNGSTTAGFGWSLQAGSTLSRCARHPFHDGTYGEIDYSRNDALCLDGKRLVLVKGEAFANGSEFRPMQEDFSSVRFIRSSAHPRGLF